MRHRIYIEKKTEYAYAAQRLYRHLTEQCGMHGVSEVRILRCLNIFSNAADLKLILKSCFGSLLHFMSFLISVHLLYLCISIYTHNFSSFRGLKNITIFLTLCLSD